MEDYDWDETFKLVRRAQRAEDYELANVAWATLADLSVRQKKASFFWVGGHTFSNAFFATENYYELAGLRSPVGFPETIMIPAPLLSSGSTAMVFKTAIANAGLLGGLSDFFQEPDGKPKPARERIPLANRDREIAFLAEIIRRETIKTVIGTRPYKDEATIGWWLLEPPALLDELKKLIQK